MNTMEQEIEQEAANYKFCGYCGDMFIAHHDLQQYCPEKNGRKDYCKYQQKKMVNENRLAEKVIELSKAGVRLYEPKAIEKNENRLEAIMGSDSQKIVTSILLDLVGYQVSNFTSKVPIKGTCTFLLTVGHFTLELIDNNGDLLTFKVTRL